MAKVWNEATDSFKVFNNVTLFPTLPFYLWPLDLTYAHHPLHGSALKMHQWFIFIYKHY